MKNLYKKTTITAGIAAIIYLLLFLFFDKTIDLWVHNTIPNTWIFQLSTAISFSAKGAFIKLAIALCFILIIAIDPSIKNSGREIYSISVLVVL